MTATTKATEAGAALSISTGSSDSESQKHRGNWGNPIEFVLACLGYAVGLGNVWRFPYLCFRNGGGAFLIPYFLMMIAMGVPIFYLELYLGQYSGAGPIEVFYRLAPGFTGLGYCAIIIIMYIIIYYMVIVAWTLYYTIMSFYPTLGWGDCWNDFNTNYCYSASYDIECRIDNNNTILDQTYYNRTCTTIKEICSEFNMDALDGKFCFNSTISKKVAWNKIIKRVLASEEYYNKQVLGRQDDSTWESFGEIQWHLVGCLAAAWIVAFLCVIKGVQSAGKVVYFTALFPYVMLTALLIRGVTLEGSTEGILYYITPQWDLLADGKVWGDAASQIFYSFGVACGSLITLASYNNFKNNCHFDAWFVCVANFLTSIFAGFAIFAVLGFQAHIMEVEVKDVVKDGPGLAFVAYPEAILQMPIPQLWAILFFFMLFILGLGCQFGGIEAVNTTIIDHYPWLRAHQWKVTLGTCTVCFLLGLPMCFSGGVYLFTLMDWNTASWAILLVGTCECLAAAWCYGGGRVLTDLRDMGMKLHSITKYYWWSAWLIIAPASCIGIFIFTLATWTSASYEEYIFPWWAEMLGWMIGVSTILPLPLGFLWAYFYKGLRGSALFAPTGEWGPAAEAILKESVSSAETIVKNEDEINKVGYVNEAFD